MHSTRAIYFRFWLTLLATCFSFSFLDNIHLIRSRDHPQTSAAHAIGSLLLLAAPWTDTLGVVRRVFTSLDIWLLLNCLSD